IRYDEFCCLWLEKNCTPIFEWCSARTKVVLHYDEDLLVLTGLRHNLTGDYIPFAEMAESAAEYSIPVTQAWKGSFDGLQQFMDQIKQTNGIEGFVLRFASGVWPIFLHFFFPFSIQC